MQPVIKNGWIKAEKLLYTMIILLPATFYPPDKELYPDGRRHWRSKNKSFDKWKHIH